jgi:hypothetical protein
VSPMDLTFLASTLAVAVNLAVAGGLAAVGVHTVFSISWIRAVTGIPSLKDMHGTFM